MSQILRGRVWEEILESHVHWTGKFYLLHLAWIEERILQAAGILRIKVMECCIGGEGGRSQKAGWESIAPCHKPRLLLYIQSWIQWQKLIDQLDHILTVSAHKIFYIRVRSIYLRHGDSIWHLQPHCYLAGTNFEWCRGWLTHKWPSLRSTL